jgi:lipopolysaccharide export system protein LptA
MKKIIPLCLLILCGQLYSKAQIVGIDSNGLKLIRITHTDQIVKNESDKFQRFIGAVIIEHDGITMTCDSAFLYLEQNYVEAFSNVNILKANGTNAHSNYIKYTGNNNTAFMQGGVSIIDGGNTLNTEELTYNIKTKIGKYYKGGTLQTEGTTVSSVNGNYNGYSQQTYFKDSVVVTNEKYTILSKELTYNIKSKLVKLLDESTIISENSTIYTKTGTYDSKTSQANFTSRTTVESDDQIIIGNTMTYNDKTGMGKAKGDVYIIDTKNETKLTSNEAEYNKRTGYGKATGNVRIENEGGKSILTSRSTEYNKKTGYAIAKGDVVFIDTVQRTQLRSGVVEFNEFSKFMMATVKPKLITVTDDDSLYMRADTMLSMRIKDQGNVKKIALPQSKKNTPTLYSYNLLYADSTAKGPEGEEEPKLVIANHTVKLYADSMQAVCDSLSYSQQDSIFRLYKSPVMWSKKQQSNADTIIIHTQNNKLSELNLINNGLLVSETGYDTYYDQVAGTYINAYFVQNEINYVHVDQNAESIYYAKDDAEAYIGTNRAESAEMNVYFKNKEVDHIVFVTEPKGDFYPIDKLNDGIKFLDSFKLYTDRKPKSKEEILND